MKEIEYTTELGERICEANNSEKHMLSINLQFLIKNGNTKKVDQIRSKLLSKGIYV